MYFRRKHKKGLFKIRESEKNSNIDLSRYENRRQELIESDQPIMGIFYILNDVIIPDYYTECFFSNAHTPLSKERYHSDFYAKYIRKKYPEFTGGEKQIPRGRMEPQGRNSLLYIDKCYAENMEIIEEIKRLYKVHGTCHIVTSESYTCPKCRQ